jgi:hypothetical protein
MRRRIFRPRLASALLPERSNSRRQRRSFGRSARSFSAKKARLSAAHARTNFCECPASRRRICTTRLFSVGDQENRGRARTTWSRTSQWSSSARGPMNKPLCGLIHCGCSCASFSSRSVARIDTSQSLSVASPASSGMRLGFARTRAKARFDRAIERRSPPRRNERREFVWSPVRQACCRFSILRVWQAPGNCSSPRTSIYLNPLAFPGHFLVRIWAMLDAAARTSGAGLQSNRHNARRRRCFP